MCGRYTLTIDKSTIEKRCGGRFYIAQPSFDWAPTYNAAPSQLYPWGTTVSSVVTRWGPGSPVEAAGGAVERVGGLVQPDPG